MQSEASGLLPLTRYTFCLVATNEAGESYGPAMAFETKRAAPMVEEESFADVGSGSAELRARINAENSPSEYRFEYATSAEYATDSKYSATTPATSLGAGHEAVGTPARLDGLAPATEYDFRVTATNAAGESAQGNDMTLKTLPSGVLGLPDGRVYERVSPVEDENANVYAPNAVAIHLPFSEGIYTERPFQAAASGDAIAYPGDPTTGGTGYSGPQLGNQYIATRAAGGGWTQAAIQPPGYYLAEYVAFFERSRGRRPLVAERNRAGRRVAAALPGSPWRWLQSALRAVEQRWQLPAAFHQGDHVSQVRGRIRGRAGRRDHRGWVSAFVCGIFRGPQSDVVRGERRVDG